MLASLPDQPPDPVVDGKGSKGKSGEEEITIGSKRKKIELEKKKRMEKMKKKRRKYKKNAA